MKKNRTMRVAALLLALTLITSCFVGGTMAKYTTEVTGTATATVATWAIEVGDFNSSSSTTQTFSLPLYTTNIYDEKDETAVADTDIANSNTVAPGTWGYYDVAVKNNSQVNLEYTAEVTGTGDPAISYFLVKDPTAVTYTKTGVQKLENQAVTMNATSTIRVYWYWSFDGEDTANQGKEVEATLTVTATQVD